MLSFSFVIVYDQRRSLPERRPWLRGRLNTMKARERSAKVPQSMLARSFLRVTPVRFDESAYASGVPRRHNRARRQNVFGNFK